MRDSDFCLSAGFAQCKSRCGGVESKQSLLHLVGIADSHFNLIIVKVDIIAGNERAEKIFFFVISVTISA